MKRLYTIITALLLVVAATAQTTPTKMKINLTNGLSQTFELANISDITFEGEEVTPPTPSGDVYEIDIPTSFSTGSVQKAMADGNKVAEICYEYIKSEGKRMVVVYPVDSDGKVDLTKGIAAADGGSVIWDASTNTCTYTAGSGALSKIYVQDGELKATTTATELVSTTVEADLLVDKRGLVTNKYKIVKIGCQYWMAENLRAVSYTNGTSIPLLSSDDADTWDTTKEGAYHKYGDNDDYFSLYGAMYNGYAVMSESGLAPEGWEIPTKEAWSKLKTYGGNAATNYRSDAEDSWLDNHTGTNVTGFSALPGGYFSKSTGDSSEGNYAYFWSSTSTYDSLSRAYTLLTPYMTGTGTNFVVSDFGVKTYNFGCYVRCIRK